MRGAKTSAKEGVKDDAGDLVMFTNYLQQQQQHGRFHQGGGSLGSTFPGLLALFTNFTACSSCTGCSKKKAMKIFAYMPK